MKISIVPDQYGSQSYSSKWALYLQKRGHQVNFVRFADQRFLEHIQDSDGLMWRSANNPDDKQKARRILYLVEKYLDIPVFPDNNTYWHYDDKVSQYYLFKALDVPSPKTWLFWEKDQALQWSEDAAYPVVHKLSVGAGSSNVSLIKSGDEAKQQIEIDFDGFIPGKIDIFPRNITRRNLSHIYKRAKHAMKYFAKGDYPPLPHNHWQPEKNYAYFQEFLPNNDFDIRVTIIGERAFVFRRWNRVGDFRASGSGKLDYTISAIGDRCIQIAFDISTKGAFQCMAYDFLLDHDVPVVSEISYTFADQAVNNCSGYWDKKFIWHEGHIWPEEAQVDDFISGIETKNH